MAGFIVNGIWCSFCADTIDPVYLRIPVLGTIFKLDDTYQIRRAIADEDPRNPLSDEALAKLLKASGLSVARRTVAKYRESMRIPASSLRKKHF